MAKAIHALCLLMKDAAVQKLHTTDGRGNDKALLKTVMTELRCQNTCFFRSTASKQNNIRATYNRVVMFIGLSTQVNCQNLLDRDFSCGVSNDGKVNGDIVLAVSNDVLQPLVVALYLQTRSNHVSRHDR